MWVESVAERTMPEGLLVMDTKGGGLGVGVAKGFMVGCGVLDGDGIGVGVGVGVGAGVGEGEGVGVGVMKLLVSWLSLQVRDPPGV